MMSCACGRANSLPIGRAIYGDRDTLVRPRRVIEKAAAITSRTAYSEGAMADKFDIVVAGAGHNSLVAAAYLAKAGYRCLVLEGRPVLDRATSHVTNAK